MNRLKEFLDKFFDDISIVIYLRRQEELFISGYSTAIKSGETYSLPSVRSFAANKDQYDYYHILNKWSEIFGKENINVYLYDAKELVNGDIFTDYCFRVGIKKFEILVLDITVL